MWRHFSDSESDVKNDGDVERQQRKHLSPDAKQIICYIYHILMEEHHDGQMKNIEPIW